MAEIADKTADQLADERMASVERQLNKKLPKGVQRNIVCPYCGHLNFQRQRNFCCMKLRAAIAAVLLADRMKKQAAIAERAANN